MICGRLCCWARCISSALEDHRSRKKSCVNIVRCWSNRQVTKKRKWRVVCRMTRSQRKRTNQGSLCWSMNNLRSMTFLLTKTFLCLRNRLNELEQILFAHRLKRRSNDGLTDRLRVEGDFIDAATEKRSLTKCRRRRDFAFSFQFQNFFSRENYSFTFIRSNFSAPLVCLDQIVLVSTRSTNDSIKSMEIQTSNVGVKLTRKWADDSQPASSSVRSRWVSFDQFDWSFLVQSVWSDALIFNFSWNQQTRSSRSINIDRSSHFVSPKETFDQVRWRIHFAQLVEARSLFCVRTLSETWQSPVGLSFNENSDGRFGSQATDVSHCRTLIDEVSSI